jgi:hypothetical protein
MAAGTFLAMLSPPGWGLAGEEGIAEEHRRGRCHRATSATRTAVHPDALSVHGRRPGKLRFRGL